MPHIIVEYSNDIEQGTDVPTMLVEMHNALAEQGIDKGRIKTRGICLTHAVVGNAKVDKGQMAHITILLLEGRDVDTKTQYLKPVYEVAVKHITDKFPDCAVTLEVRDMQKETYIL